MTKYGLRARVFILTLAPTLIIGLLLSAFFTFNRYQDLEHQLLITGENIIEPLAISSEYPLAENNREALRRLLSYSHRKHSNLVRSIAVFNTDNKLFVTSNFHRNFDVMMYPEHQPIPMQLQTEKINNTLILRAPILQESSLNTLDHNQMSLPIGYISVELDLSSLRLQQYQEILSALMVLLFGLGLSALFAYRLMKDVTRPISHMVDVVDRIRRGHLDVRIEGQLLGELDTLKNGINAMAISLSEYHIEMQQSIDQATSDLRETLEQLEIQNIELDIAKKRAQEAARVKSEFLANMSHELRTPLNGVIGFTRQLLKTPLTNSQEEYLQTIDNSANNLLSIINDILDFSKLEAGKLALEQITFPIAPVLDDMIRLLSPSAHEKGLELILNLDENVPDFVMGDPLRLQQVLTNLIGNAVKFTEHGHIEIGVTRKVEHPESNEILFSVKDTGIGIKKSQQKQLFQAFSQADTSISRRYGGTGLGLVITQKLVSQMGGNIQLTSEINEGSIFYFRLFMTKTEQTSLTQQVENIPYRNIVIIEANKTVRQHLNNQMTRLGLTTHSYANLPEIWPSHVDIVLLSASVSQPLTKEILLPQIQQLQKHCHTVFVSLPITALMLSEELLHHGISGCITKPISYHALKKALSHAPKTKTPKIEQKQILHFPLKILAVDDNPANLKLISALLEDQIDQLFTANSGKKAIEIAENNALDLIFMDIQMPEMDGVNASKKIHDLPQHTNTPIIAVTAHAMVGERERLIKAGMNDYLTKPIEESALQHCLQQWGHHHKPQIITPIQTSIAPNNKSWDWSLALKQAAGKADLAQEMLALLLLSFSDVKDDIQNALDNPTKDTTSLIDTIHKLHGSAAYCGVPQLKSLCYLLEGELRKGASIEEIEPELFELLDEMIKVQQQTQSQKGA
jgi:two-component system sensor histidine kinase BarA